MHFRLLLDGGVRRTTVLLAQLSTAAGVRSPLSHVAAQVVLQLARELEAQGVKRAVAADDGSAQATPLLTVNDDLAAVPACAAESKTTLPRPNRCIGLLALLALGCSPGLNPNTQAGGGAASHPSGQGEPEAESAHGYQHDFSDVERYAAQFEAPERAGLQKPESVIALLELAPDQIGAKPGVVDLGAGTGYFLPLLSRALSKVDGTLLALDAEPRMVEYLRRRIARESLTNTTAAWVAPDDPALVPGSVDRILIVNTWHHLPRTQSYLRKLRDALKPAGTMLIVEFTENAPMGPPTHARVTSTQVLDELGSGDSFKAELVSEDLPYQFVVRARPFHDFPYGYKTH